MFAGGDFRFKTGRHESGFQLQLSQKKCNYTLRELKFPSDATLRRSNDFNDNLLARSASSRECIEQL